MDFWIISLSAWLPFAGVSIALLLFDITGGNDDPSTRWQTWQDVGHDAEL